MTSIGKNNFTDYYKRIFNFNNDDAKKTAAAPDENNSKGVKKVSATRDMSGESMDVLSWNATVNIASLQANSTPKTDEKDVNNANTEDENNIENENNNEKLSTTIDPQLSEDNKIDVPIPLSEHIYVDEETLENLNKETLEINPESRAEGRFPWIELNYNPHMSVEDFFNALNIKDDGEITAGEVITLYNTTEDENLKKLLSFFTDGETVTDVFKLACAGRSADSYDSWNKGITLGTDDFDLISNNGEVSFYSLKMLQLVASKMSEYNNGDGSFENALDLLIKFNKSGQEITDNMKNIFDSVISGGLLPENYRYKTPSFDDLVFELNDAVNPKPQMTLEDLFAKLNFKDDGEITAGEIITLYNTTDDENLKALLSVFTDGETVTDAFKLACAGFSADSYDSWNKGITEGTDDTDLISNNGNVSYYSLGMLKIVSSLLSEYNNGDGSFENALNLLIEFNKSGGKMTTQMKKLAAKAYETNDPAEMRELFDSLVNALDRPQIITPIPIKPWRPNPDIILTDIEIIKSDANDIRDDMLKQTLTDLKINTDNDDDNLLNEAGNPIFEYDENGQVISYIQTDASGKAVKMVAVFDDNGNIISFEEA